MDSGAGRSSSIKEEAAGPSVMNDVLLAAAPHDWLRATPRRGAGLGTAGQVM